jgi:hypothetical protein
VALFLRRVKGWQEARPRSSPSMQSPRSTNCLYLLRHTASDFPSYQCPQSTTSYWMYTD